MQDAELFIHSAEIAGVFVGFGALIAIRSGATMTTSEINAIRWVMTAGIWVLVVALAPAFIASYGLGGRELWLASSLLALGFLAIVLVVFARTPENRAEVQANVGRIPWSVPAWGDHHASRGSSATGSGRTSCRPSSVRCWTPRRRSTRSVWVSSAAGSTTAGCASCTSCS